MSDNITLNRADLKRLAEVLRDVPSSWARDTHPAFVAGWSAAVEALNAVADRMPELYGADGCPVAKPAQNAQDAP